MPEELTVDEFILSKKSENFDSKLQELLEKNQKEFSPDDIKILEELGNQLWKIHVAVNSEFRHNTTQEIQDKSNDLIKKYADINKKLGEVLLAVKPKSEEHYYLLKKATSDKFIVALQKYFMVNQERGVQSNVLADAHERVVSETESPYYVIKDILIKVKSIYDELAVHYLSKKDYRGAHQYYYLLGEMIIKEIHYGKIINDSMLYRDVDYGYLFYNAGLAFSRSYNSIKERYIITHYAPPIAVHLRSNLSDVFNTGNRSLPPNEVSMRCFEESIPFLLKTGDKEYYLKAKEELYNLKSLNNDFEFNISRLFLKIAKQFTKNKNIVTKSVTQARDIREGDVRDYFLSHINVVRNEIALAESTRTVGFTDLTVIGKNYRDEIIEAIAEFKVWGRNSTGSHSYRNVINQLKGYLTDFENFGIIVMINPNQSSIKDSYIRDIINSDDLLVPDSLDEAYNGTDFVNLKTKNYVDESRSRTIVIYHFIINISNLYVDAEETNGEESEASEETPAEEVEET